MGETMTDGARELARRMEDGLEVCLYWHRGRMLSVLVRDARFGSAFEIPAPADRALDVYYRPFAYATDAMLEPVLVLQETEAILRAAWESHENEAERVLATVLFTDIVGSSERAAALGDRAWRALLSAHDAAVRRQLVRFRGCEVKTTGDGFLVSFESPARAILCGRAIVETVRELGLEVRAGLHAGECELVDHDMAGIAVHIGARVVAVAEPGEVLVSSTVRDLVAGSDIAFEDRGVHPLKGIPGEWRLYAVAGAV